MGSFNFTKWNKITGWLVFAIALTTYWLTVEPTVSFWDAGEYIATSSNLEVGHPRELHSFNFWVPFSPFLRRTPPTLRSP